MFKLFSERFFRASDIMNPTQQACENALLTITCDDPSCKPVSLVDVAIGDVWLAGDDIGFDTFSAPGGLFHGTHGRCFNRWYNAFFPPAS